MLALQRIPSTRALHRKRCSQCQLLVQPGSKNACSVWGFLTHIISLIMPYLRLQFSVRVVWYCAFLPRPRLTKQSRCWWRTVTHHNLLTVSERLWFLETLQVNLVETTPFSLSPSECLSIFSHKCQEGKLMTHEEEDLENVSADGIACSEKLSVISPQDSWSSSWLFKWWM